MGRNVAAVRVHHARECARRVDLDGNYGRLWTRTNRRRKRSRKEEEEEEKS